MGITVPKPLTTIDDGFYHDANAAFSLACDRLATLDPAPPEFGLPASWHPGSHR